MSLPIQLISTDFDGTFFAEREAPPVPASLEALIGEMQAQGAKWVVNTGRDLGSVRHSLKMAQLAIAPDFMVTVEREIHCLEGDEYLPAHDWNQSCTLEHQALFERVRPDLADLYAWVNERFEAMVYEDAYSPFCLTARTNQDADRIHDYLNAYCEGVPNLTVVRNDIYARFSHAAYNKGTAMAEIARRLGVRRERVFAAGDHLNDLPMLSLEHAGYVMAPSNAVPAVKEQVRRQHGYISDQPWGHGVAAGLEHYRRNGDVSVATSAPPGATQG